MTKGAPPKPAHTSRPIFNLEKKNNQIEGHSSRIRRLIYLRRQRTSIDRQRILVIPKLQFDHKFSHSYPMLSKGLPEIALQVAVVPVIICPNQQL